MNRRELTVQEIQTVLDLYLVGYSITKVAKELHICRDYVKDILIEHNIEIRDQAAQALLRAANVKRTCLTKYGVENAFQVPSIQEKIKATNLEKYGTEYYASTNMSKIKVHQTWQRKSQDEIDCRTEKTKQTNLARYGVDVPVKNKNIKQKIEATNIERYGVLSVLADKEKMKAAVIAKYGVANVFQNEDIKEKIKQSMAAKYGVEHFFQNELNMGKSVYKKYVVEDEYFDSLPELAIWLYMKEHNIAIQRNNSAFTYFFDNIEHKCFPDFIIDGKLVEIKGDHLFKKMLLENTIENAKYNCLLKNNVEIWTSSMYAKYLKWFTERGYNKDDFKRKQEENDIRNKT